MFEDPIVEEVRRVRQEYARRFNYDLHAIAADLRKHEQEHPERLVSFPPKSPRKARRCRAS
jgi:hypothetical protein